MGVYLPEPRPASCCSVPVAASGSGAPEGSQLRSESTIRHFTYRAAAFTSHQRLPEGSVGFLEALG